MSGFLDNLEASWSPGFQFESKAMANIDSMGRENIISEISEISGIELTPTQKAIIIINSIEQQLRNNIAIEIENKFHGLYHGASHDIAKFVKDGNSSI